MAAGLKYIKGKAAYYGAFRAARQEINSGVAGMKVQGGFDARA